jgi:hypothetical protein
VKREGHKVIRGREENLGHKLEQLTSSVDDNDGVVQRLTLPRGDKHTGIIQTAEVIHVVCEGRGGRHRHEQRDSQRTQSAVRKQAIDNCCCRFTSTIKPSSSCPGRERTRRMERKERPRQRNEEPQLLRMPLPTLVLEEDRPT